LEDPNTSVAPPANANARLRFEVGRQRRIVFHGERQVSSEAFTPHGCSPAQDQVRSESSLISTGTELIALQRVFKTGSDWDRWVRYPLYPGLHRSHRRPRQ